MVDAWLAGRDSIREYYAPALHSFVELQERAETAEQHVRDLQFVYDSQMESWNKRMARAEAALDDMTAQRDGALATAGIAEAKAEILRERAERAEAALAAAAAPCVWVRDGVYLFAPCCYLATFTQYEFSFCPGCGHRVEVAERPPSKSIARTAGAG
ncbi:MAG: hypothetical protein KAX65_04675 [Caldilineaceae bacterium]|nr:hypothetical protein [Caldilineaceae bacterium]